MRLNQRKAGAALSYASMILGYIVSLAYTPIMIRLLGQSEFGLYNLVASVVAYLGVLNFGFGSAYMRFYMRYKVKEDDDNIAKLNGMFITIFSFIGLIAIVAGIILVFKSEAVLGTQLTAVEQSKAKVILIILVFNTAFSFPNIIFNSHITANERFIFQKIVQMIKIIGNPFIVLPLLLFGYGSVGMAIATTFINITVEIVNIIFCFKKLKMRFAFKSFDHKLMREVTTFSSFIFMNLLIDQINWNVDKLILGRVHGTVSVAVYGLAAQLNTYYISLSTAISRVFVPRVHRLVAANNDSNELTMLFTRIGRIQFIILALVSSGLVFFGRAFFELWAGPNYVESFPIALLLILPVTLPLIQNIGIEIQQAKNMHQFRSVVYFLIALMNVGLTLWLAKPLRGIGAALGTAIALIVGNGLIMNWYYHKKVGINIKYFWRQIFSFLPGLILPAMVGILMNRYGGLYQPVRFIAFGILYVITYCVSMWFFGINNYERELFRKPTLKLYSRIIRKH
jgi:O-antigen/teichoic acid export membrane protein